MNILVTGAKGFVGKNLVWSLRNLRDGKDKTRPALTIDEIFEYDIDSTPEELDRYCAKADFVFNLAGVNRPVATTDEEKAKLFSEGNYGFASVLLDTLKKHGNTCPVMLSSSIQASLEGRFAGSEYGKSKLAGEELFFKYGEETGAKILVYRFPNLFGKWCRPNYNSAVATFCYNIARDLPIQVNDRNTELELLYIDDLVSGLLDSLEGKEIYLEADCKACESSVKKADGISREIHVITSGDEVNRKYAKISPTHHVTLGEIVDLLQAFHDQPSTLLVPEIAAGSFAKKLYSTYLSYLPEEKIAYELHVKEDSRGSFTELLKTVSGGQFSVNVSKPGITKGNHWHHSKWEFFIVVSGEALIQERPITDLEKEAADNNLGAGEATTIIEKDVRAGETNDMESALEKKVIEIRVCGSKPTVVHMLPGYAHNIINLSDTEDLVTLMWANESFDANKPDTFSEEV